MFARVLLGSDLFVVAALAVSFLLQVVLLRVRCVTIVQVAIVAWLVFSLLFGEVFFVDNPFGALYFAATTPVAMAISSGAVQQRTLELFYCLFAGVTATMVAVNGVNPYEPFYADTSQNYISAVALFLTGSIYLRQFLNGKRKPTVWQALVAFVLSILATGRSGIIVASLLLMIVVYTRNRRRFMFVALPIGTIVGVSFGPFVRSRFLVRFAQRGFHSPRLEIWAQTFREADTRSILVGFDPSELSLARRYGGNFHNSFVTYWANTGLAGVPLFLLLIAAAGILWRRSRFLGLLFVLLSLRAATDTFVLTGWLDFSYLAFVFYAFRRPSGSTLRPTKGLSSVPRLC